YVVDNSGDVVTENASEGTDLVQTSVTYTMSVNTENLTLSGEAAIDGTGNDLANNINGNAAANSLLGGGGNDSISGNGGDDTLAGGEGDDVYIVDAGSSTPDVVIENANEGYDIVQSYLSFTLGQNIEQLTLLDGGGFPVDGTGNTLDN